MGINEGGKSHVLSRFDPLVEFFEDFSHHHYDQSR